MSLPLAYLPEAQDDIDAAYAYYEQRSVGLGERFLEALREMVDRIADSPELFGTVQGDIPLPSPPVIPRLVLPMQP